MSEQVVVTGTVRPLTLTLEEFLEISTAALRGSNTLEQYMEKHGYKDGHGGTALESLFEDLFGHEDNYTHVNGRVYETNLKRRIDDPNFVYMIRNDEGTVSIAATFDTGGTCIQEIIEENIDYAMIEGSVFR